MILVSLDKVTVIAFPNQQGVHFVAHQEISSPKDQGQLQTRVSALVAFTCSKPSAEALEKGVKYVQSLQ